jgi:hypothetical protein
MYLLLIDDNWTLLILKKIGVFVWTLKTWLSCKFDKNIFSYLQETQITAHFLLLFQLFLKKHKIYQ